MACAGPRNDSGSESGAQKSVESDYSADAEDEALPTNGGNVLKFVGNRTSSSDMITVKIDLTDPEDLARKLELIDLTDTETDMILEKATELNTWLRQELLRQSEFGSDSCEDDPQYSPMYFVSAPAAGAMSDTEDSGRGVGGYRRSRTYSGSATTLPLLPRLNSGFTHLTAQPQRSGPTPSYHQSRPGMRSASGAVSLHNSTSSTTGSQQRSRPEPARNTRPYNRQH